MKKKKAKKIQKENSPQIYTVDELISKLCSNSSSNDLTVEHNSIIKECITELADLYHGYINSFRNRTKQIDSFIRLSKLEEAKELLVRQNELLREHLKKTEEKKILKSYADQHRIFKKQKVGDPFKNSGSYEFIVFANQKYNNYLEELEARANQLGDKIVDFQLKCLKERADPRTILENSLWEKFLKANGLEDLDKNLESLIEQEIQKLDVRCSLMKDIAFYEKAAKRQLREIENPSFKVTGTLPWKILPSDSSWNEIQNVLQQEFTLGNITNKEMIAARIRMQRITELSPKQIYKGLGSFSDYFALVFERFGTVVFESIKYGNAIYVVKGDWIKLSQRSKKELRTNHKAVVIRHEGDWFSRLKSCSQSNFY